MNRSPLHDLNQSLGARFVDFGGWEMPVQYDSILTEHRSVRRSSGIFDVTHLGRFELTGEGSHAAIRSLLCNDVERIQPGRCQYTMALNLDGGIVDDLIVWWWDDQRFWVMPNAANHEKLKALFAAAPGCHVDDLQPTTVFLAVQGPDASDLLARVIGTSPGRFRCSEIEWAGGVLAIAGTGYTGEAGAEVCVIPELAETLFESLVESGSTPCGLGARDTLRLEAGLPLWGADIDETTTPDEAGLSFAVSLEHDFAGREALSSRRERGLTRKLAGFVMDERGIPRHGHRIVTSGGSEGTVTSGNISPMLETGIGLAYLTPPAQQGESVEVTIRERAVTGHLVEPPFFES